MEYTDIDICKPDGGGLEASHHSRSSSTTLPRNLAAAQQPHQPRNGKGEALRANTSLRPQLSQPNGPPTLMSTSTSFTTDYKQIDPLLTAAFRMTKGEMEEGRVKLEKDREKEKDKGKK